MVGGDSRPLPQARDGLPLLGDPLGGVARDADVVLAAARLVDDEGRVALGSGHRGSPGAVVSHASPQTGPQSARVCEKKN